MEKKIKTPKERDTADLLELVCQLHSRSSAQPNNKAMHDNYVEARAELDSRIQSLSPSTDSSEVSETDVEKEYDKFYSDLKNVPDLSYRRGVKIHACKFAKWMRSKLKSQWVSVDEFNWLVKNEDEIKQALVNHNLPDEVYEGFGKLFKHLKNES